MGTSIIAQHFSPAQTEPTPREEIKQSTTKQSETLDVDTENMEKVKQ
jgi:chemotaxis protein MotB